jgi:arylformamidase
MQMVDLSVDLADGMPRYPSAYLPPVSLVPVATHEKDARSAQVLTVGTHVSTHMDAPLHAIPGGRTIDQIPLDWTCGPATVVRIAGKDRNRPITASDLEGQANLLCAERIILDTGWAKAMWGTQEYFVNGPYLTRDAAKYVAGQRNLKLLGMDFANIDAAGDTVPGKPAPNHQLILANDLVLLENLLRLEELPTNIFLVSVPLKLVGGDGCVCRPVAFFPLEPSR